MGVSTIPRKRVDAAEVPTAPLTPNTFCRTIPSDLTIAGKIFQYHKTAIKTQNTITLGSVSGNYEFKNLCKEINKKLSFLKTNELNLEIETNIRDDFSIKELWETKTNKKSKWSKSFIDLHNDVTTKDLKQAINEGYDRIEHLKRYTTNSMGTDQGKISSINSLGIVSKILNKNRSFLPPLLPGFVFFRNFLQ